MMRRLAERALGRPVDALLSRLERGVQAEDHVRLARRLLDPARGPLAPPRLRALPEGLRAAAATVREELGAALAGAHDAPAPSAPDDEAPPPDLLASLPHGPRGHAATRAALHAPARLPAPAAGARDDPALVAALEEAAEAHVFAEEGGDPPRAEGAGLALLAGLQGGALGAAGARTLALRLASPLAPPRWFPKAGVGPGTAALLRSRLAAEEADSPALDDLRERLLRHVEVRREEALVVRGASAQDGRQVLERLRFALALLDVAERRRDGRFLNAALKLLDWQHARVARGIGDRTVGLLVAAHYAACVVRQERLLEALWP